MPSAETVEARIEICRREQLPPGGKRIVQVDGKEIGIFNIKGTYRAVLNFCPHEGARICDGRVAGTTMPSNVGEFIWGLEEQILACPWHGWEFNLADGRSLHGEACRLKTYKVAVVNGRVYLCLEQGRR